MDSFPSISAEDQTFGQLEEVVHAPHHHFPQLPPWGVEIAICPNESCGKNATVVSMQLISIGDLTHVITGAIGLN